MSRACCLTIMQLLGEQCEDAASSEAPAHLLVFKFLAGVVRNHERSIQCRALHLSLPSLLHIWKALYMHCLQLGRRALGKFIILLIRGLQTICPPQPGGQTQNSNISGLALETQTTNLSDSY